VRRLVGYVRRPGRRSLAVNRFVEAVRAEAAIALDPMRPAPARAGSVSARTGAVSARTRAGVGEPADR
jgi:hypothetical protein